jgi:hypothetical protein
MSKDIINAAEELNTSSDPEHVDAPVTLKAYAMCAFASFGGIFFGYDSGYINGVLASPVFIEAIAPGQSAISSSTLRSLCPSSLLVPFSVLSLPATAPTSLVVESPSSPAAPSILQVSLFKCSPPLVSPQSSLAASSPVSE